MAVCCMVLVCMTISKLFHIWYFFELSFNMMSWSNLENLVQNTHISDYRILYQSDQHRICNYCASKLSLENPQCFEPPRLLCSLRQSINPSIHFVSRTLPINNSHGGELSLLNWFSVFCRSVFVSFVLVYDCICNDCPVSRIALTACSLTLEETKELQKLRKRPNGVSIEDLATIKTKPKEQSTSVSSCVV